MFSQFIQRKKIQKIGNNTNGRDFIIGDLHGCFHAITSLLKHVKFNKSVDRLISVGDLVDRGPESFSCLELLEKPWFYCVAGNHEMMLIEFLQNPYIANPYELDWIKKKARTFTEQKQIAGRFLNRLINLPLVLSVGSGDKHFFVVHGELVDKKMIDNQNIEKWSFSDYQKVEVGAIWGRQIIHAYKGRKLLKCYKSTMSPIYSGHTIVNAPLRVDKQIYMDRGAYMPYFFKNKQQYANIKDPGLLMIEIHSENAWVYSTANENIENLLIIK